MERGDSGMNEKEIYYCKDCGTLDYAHGQCPKCGSLNIVRAEESSSVILIQMHTN